MANRWYMKPARLTTSALIIVNQTGSGIIHRLPNISQPLQNFETSTGVKDLLRDKKIFSILTGKEIDKKVLSYISLVSEEYHEDRFKVEILLTIQCVPFISEEVEVNTKLGKWIKFLGILQILNELAEQIVTANFSQGMNGRIFRSSVKRGVLD